MSTNIVSEATRAVPQTVNSVVDPRELWPALVSGRARIVESGVTAARHYFQLVTLDAAPDAKALSACRVRMLERVLLGEPPKVIAMEAGCATSTVASTVGNCLLAMGLDRRSSRVPALLVLMLHALRSKVQRLSLHVERRSGQADGRQLVSSARLEHCLSHRLSAGEFAVASLLVEGKTHVEIARRRGSSVRTVANQISSIYRKLGVSGRMHLLCYVVAANTPTN